MKTSALGWVAATIVLILSGCAAQKVALMPESRAKVGAAVVILEVPQEEIFAEINPSNSSAAMGGGLLFALIDTAVNNSRAKDAELKVEPYRNALHDFDFQALLRREVERAVADLTWLDTVTVEVDRSPEGKLRQDRLANGTSDSIFVLRVGYSMTPDFGSLHVTGDAKILPTKAGEARRQKDAAKPKATAATAASEKPSQPLYWQTFTATQSTPADSPGPAGEVWTRNNGAALRAALEAATRNLVDQVAEDVDGRRAANKPK